MTAEISTDPWATLDQLLGVEVATPVDQGLGDMAVYGRCSTEDNQDPETSRGWQVGNARKFVEPLGGRVAAVFFDVGQSRSVPWERRPEAARLLAALKRPDRGWNAVVVGEGTRCWFGNQFSLIAPRFAAYGVDLWVPELGGKYDPRNPSHKMLMSVLGGMSESERQHVQARVRAAMDAQVINEGRYQGGRPPYGYQVIDAGPHPNPRKAAEGYRLRVLAIDDGPAEVVRRIFTEYLDGRGDRAIANGLNRDGIPCPSALRPEQNRHRLADGWQGSTVRSILDNPRYTGYAFFGRWTKHETLLDPDDVAAGHVVRFRRSAPDRVVRSRRPAHPAIVSVETFTQAQLLRRSKGAAGLLSACRAERSERPTKRIYLFRGRIRCAVCSRKMEASPRAHGMYYRCPARTLAPGSPALAEHPPAVYLREDPIMEAVNSWLGDRFGPANVDATVAALVGSQTDSGARTADHEAARKRLADAEAKLRRFQAAIASGIDPAALVEVTNAAQKERAAARAELDGTPSPDLITDAEVYAMIDALGDVGAAVSTKNPTRLANLYAGADLQVRYDPAEDAAEVRISLGTRVNKAGVRGLSRTLRPCSGPADRVCGGGAVRASLPGGAGWSRWVRRGCAVLVALVAAYASYEHQRRFALDWGAEAVSAALWPLSVDGLVVLASVGLLEVDATASWRARWSVRAAFLLGVAVSLVANIAVAPVLSWQSIVVAGWPPVALLLAVELLTVRRHHDGFGQAQGLSQSATIRNGSPARAMSVRAAVQHVLENSSAPLTNSEIVAALRDRQGHSSDKRLRANVTNSLWTLRKRGLVECRDGKNAIAGQPMARA